MSQLASQDEIRQSYRRLILLHHPDKQRKQEHDDRTQERQAEALNVAYAVLSDAVLRVEYDEALKQKLGEHASISRPTYARLIHQPLLKQLHRHPLHLQQSRTSCHFPISQ